MSNQSLIRSRNGSQVPTLSNILGVQNPSSSMSSNPAQILSNPITPQTALLDTYQRPNLPSFQPLSFPPKNQNRNLNQNLNLQQNNPVASFSIRPSTTPMISATPIIPSLSTIISNPNAPLFSSGTNQKSHTSSGLLASLLSFGDKLSVKRDSHNRPENHDQDGTKVDMFKHKRGILSDPNETMKIISYDNMNPDDTSEMGIDLEVSRYDTNQDIRKVKCLFCDQRPNCPMVLRIIPKCICKPDRMNISCYTCFIEHYKLNIPIPDRSAEIICKRCDKPMLIKDLIEKDLCEIPQGLWDQYESEGVIQSCSFCDSQKVKNQTRITQKLYKHIRRDCTKRRYPCPNNKCEFDGMHDEILKHISGCSKLKDEKEMNELRNGFERILSLINLLLELVLPYDPPSVGQDKQIIHNEYDDRYVLQAIVRWSLFKWLSHSKTYYLKTFTENSNNGSYSLDELKSCFMLQIYQGVFVPGTTKQYVSILDEIIRSQVEKLRVLEFIQFLGHNRYISNPYVIVSYWYCTIKIMYQSLYDEWFHPLYSLRAYCMADVCKQTGCNLSKSRRTGVRVNDPSVNISGIVCSNFEQAIDSNHLEKYECTTLENGVWDLVKYLFKEMSEIIQQEDFQKIIQ